MGKKAIISVISNANIEDDDMIEVAIQAVEAVFDWRAYERENFHTS